MAYSVDAYKTRAEYNKSFTWAKISVSYIDSMELGLCSEASRWYYIALILLAVSLDGDGHIYQSDGLLDKNIKEIAWRFRTDISILNSVFDELESAGLVEKKGQYYRLTQYTAEQIEQKKAKEDQEHKRKLAAERQARWREKNSESKEKDIEIEKEVEIEEEIEGNALCNALHNDKKNNLSPLFSNEFSQSVYSLCKKMGWGDSKSIEAAEKRTTGVQYLDFLDMLSKKGNPIAIEEFEIAKTKIKKEFIPAPPVDTEFTRNMDNFVPRTKTVNKEVAPIAKVKGD